MSLFPKPEETKQWLWPYYGTANRVYCVDSVNGNDSYSGFSWSRAKATIDAAVDLARYTLGTTTIDDSKDHHAVVLVAPGHYNEQLLFSGYNIHVIGCGPGVPGKDYGVSINYDGATAATAAVGFSGSGISLHNLHIYCAEAIPALYIAGGDNNLVENCVIECDGTNCTYGIHAVSMKGSWIKNVVIRTPATTGIFLDGGADRYAIDGGIVNCQIHGTATGVKGIHCESTMTVYNFLIHQNWIDVESGGAASIGIHNEATGNMYITDNYVVAETGATPISSASHGSLNNHISLNGTVTDPYDDD